ncbi:thioester reductase domain-containing protein [Amycolatopsis sp. CA-230715]|uniref:thioester reductase domain-containing protein n=1 Tax=Amycolatopsis sp. CA-230715 TaxID=2745196 RepID=UPI001C01035B|nr:thioester reductase domain-containing protein [Amycolatopsis sp. CA-230715]QWF82462.1 hypothetical protein HUW46_05899 [Amycolatopsis sp. CA-230715]
MSAREIEDVYDLTPLQHGMLFENLYAPGEGTYLEQSVLEFEGALDTDAYWRAWQHVVDRHPALRTTFHWNDIKKPVQTVHRRIGLPRTELDLRGLGAAEGQDRIADYLRPVRANGFDLEARPPMDLCLAVGDDRWHQLLSVHHLILDGWSVGIIMGEFLRAYRACCDGHEPGLPPAGRFRDYVAWWRRQDGAEAGRYWRDQLAGYTPPPRLDVGTPPAVRTGEIPYDWAELDLADVAEDVHAFAKRHRLTANTLVHGAWSLVLARCQHTDDLTVGTTFAHRPADVPAAESIVGCLVGTFPIRTRPREDQPVLDYLGHVQDSVLAAREHTATDLVGIQRHSGVARAGGLFESLVTYQNIPIPEFGGPVGGIRIRGYTVDTRPQLPLVLMVMPGTTMPMRLVHDRRRFGAHQAGLLLARVRHVLAAIVASDAGTTLADIDVRPEDERRRIARACADPANLAAALPAGRPLRLVDARGHEVPLGAPGLVEIGGAVSGLWARVTDDDGLEHLGDRAETTAPAAESGPADPPATPTEKAVAELMAAILDVDRVGAADNLVELGLHSLLGTRATNQIRDRWNLTVTLHALFENPTVRDLAKLIEAGGEAQPAPRGHQDLSADVTLDESITGIGPAAWHPSPSRFLLTGATGYLGSFLLDRLLRSGTATVTCLVRDRTPDDGLARVHDTLRAAGLWREEYRGRITTVCGNLTKPLLGLSEENFAALAADVQEIYHAGGTVNTLPSYRRLRSTNVGGTKEVLRLAATGRTKPVHYPSYAGLSAPELGGRELPVTGTPPEARHGYEASKWVAERLLALADERGVPTVVYRAARLVGATSPAYWNPSDATSEIVQACAYLGMVPDSAVPMPASPVDYVADGITALARKKESLGGRYHLISPQPFTFRVVGEAMTLAGYDLRSVDIDTWYSELVRRSAEDGGRRWDLVLSVVGAWKRQVADGWREAEYDTSRARSALSADLVCGPVDAAYLRGALACFASTGHLPAPAGANG